MAEAQSLKKNDTSEVTTCPVCQETYKDPVELPCKHVICLTCIEGYGREKQAGEKLPCQLCRREFTVPDKGLASFPRSTFIEKLLDVKKICSSTDATCDVCSQGSRWRHDSGDSESSNSNTAVFFCFTCRQSICASCGKVHEKLKTTEGHKTVRLGVEMTAEDLKAKCLPMTCAKHQNQDITLYCFDCKVTGCTICYIKDHNSHKFVETREIAEEFRTRIDDDMECFDRSIVKCREVLERLTREKNVTNGKAGKVDKTICKSVEQMKKALEDHKKRLIDNLELMRQERVRNIEEWTADVERHLVALQKFRFYVEKLRESGTHCDIARESDGLHEMAFQLLEIDIDAIIAAKLEPGLDIVFLPSGLANDAELDTGNLVGDVMMTAGNEDGRKPAATPTVRQIIPMSNPILAVAAFSNLVFVARQNKTDIEVYEAASLTHQRVLAVPELGPNPYGLAACSSNNCVYVSDYNNNAIHRVAANANGPRMKWYTAPNPMGLSTNKAHNVIVTSHGAHKLQEYTTRGVLLREINVQPNIGNPYLAIQLAGGEFAVTHTHRVAIVSSTGQLLSSFGAEAGSGATQTHTPYGFIVDRQGNIIVAEHGNKRILVLDPTLAKVRPVAVTVDEGMQNPRGICLDESRGRLYVGEMGGGRLIVLENMKDIAVSL